MSRKPLVAGNWKMHTTVASARDLAAAVVDGLAGDDHVGVVLCPPFPYLTTVGAILGDGPIALGGQDSYPEIEGAYTGEVSAAMLKDVGCRYVIVGHSERRHKLGETDTFINEKVVGALAVGLTVILCVGETLAERQAGTTETIIDHQIARGLDAVPADAVARVVIAYEPVWAIGTGHTASPEQAQAAHAFIRGRFAQLLGSEAAGRVPLLYGGSVKADNAAALMQQPDVDGALVGGASLKAEQFLGIVRAARR